MCQGSPVTVGEHHVIDLVFGREVEVDGLRAHPHRRARWLNSKSPDTVQTLEHCQTSVYSPPPAVRSGAEKPSRAPLRRPSYVSAEGRGGARVGDVGGLIEGCPGAEPVV